MVKDTQFWQGKGYPLIVSARVSFVFELLPSLQIFNDMLTTVCSLTVGKMLLILVQVKLTEDNPSSWFWSSESSSSKYTNNFV